MDEKFRGHYIPEGTMRVENFYDGLKILDNYEIEQGDTDNYFVKALKQKRE